MSSAMRSGSCSGTSSAEMDTAMRLVRLPHGLATTVEEADALRNRVVGEHGIAAAFTSFRGVGFCRLSAHAYNTSADYEAIAERLVPLLCDWAERGTS